MKNLPTDLLRTFVTVADLGSVTSAGEQLGRSQPAISLQLQRLENMLDKELLIRRGPQLSLSENGNLLYDAARDMLATNDAVVAQLTQPSLSGSIRIGIPSEFAITLLPKILGRFSKAYPDISLEVTCDLSRNLTAKERKGDFDVILALNDNPEKGPGSRVKTEPLVWVGKRDGVIPSNGVVPLVAAPQGCIYRKRALTQLKNSGIEARISYTIPDLAGIQAAIEEGLGVTVLAKSTVPDTLHSLKSGPTLPSLGSIGVSLITKPGADQAAKRLVNYLQASL